MRRARVLAGAGLALCTLSACSSTVGATSAPAGGSAACASAGAQWPTTVGGLPSRDVEDGVAGVAAWGDPAVIARCGVAPPAGQDGNCLEVDGIGWVIEDLSDGTRLTTYGTDPALEVLVPAAHNPAPLLLPAFDEAARALPSNGLRCR